MTKDEVQEWYDSLPCDECGYPHNSFACKIRHIQVNTGAAKAARDLSRSRPASRSAALAVLAICIGPTYL